LSWAQERPFPAGYALAPSNLRLTNRALPNTSIDESLERIGLLRREELRSVVPLAGGVSSDIVRVAAGNRSFCVKRALPQLKVAADWRAPIERNHSEAEWLRVAGAIVPDAVPQILGEDEEAGLFALEWLAPEHYPVWKDQLRDGVIELATAAEVGRRIAHIHAATAGRADIAARFATDPVFHSIRLEPYLLATCERHPDVANVLRALVATTARTKLALVHGDVSPKNILVGPRGPVFLDAECAWYGDPAFDLAFCLNHMLLKCLWRPQWRERYLACFSDLIAAYLNGVGCEPRNELESRCARLLPGLFLARVDGKSPVEYVTDEADRERVRHCAKRLLRDPPERLTEIADAWREELAKHG
jgi:aminoglycoside phosphotransferase (APT) family kinase protein